MAKAKGLESIKREKIKKVTSIGTHSTRSRPKNKHKKRNWKPYRGQGRK
tara:strand:- start:9465 stop:9611 length:147 start_codon:yes stop_codon:yes gene_type:complete